PTWLATAGYTVPDDIAFACLDLTDDSGATAGIYQDAAAIGASTVDLVAGQLLRHERGLPAIPKTSVIDGRWVNGATMPPLVVESAWAEKADFLLSNTGGPLSPRPVAYD